jgi:Do/DeqQ family serine protease
MKVHRTLLASLAAFGLVGAGAVAMHAGSSVAHATPGMPTDGSIADVAERVVDSVVTISTISEERGGPADADPFFQDPMSPYFGMAPQPSVRHALGSGVIVTSSGRILTNYHVIDDATQIKVKLYDGTELPAKVIGKDKPADLAVIQLEGHFPPIKPLAFGDSSQLRLGDIVLAVGDGLGVGKSVSMGIISAKGRGGIGIEDYEDFIQTDAAINPGNSGGALVNMKGELVGINTAIASRSGGYQGIGFAIPSNMARPIMEQLVKTGHVERGFLGVDIGTATPDLAQAKHLGAEHGAVVAEVEPNGPAAHAGLRPGDVVVAYDGAPVRTGENLRNSIAMTHPGTVATLDVVHPDASRSEVRVKLGLRSNHVAQSMQQLPSGLPQGGNWHCTRTPNGVQCESHSP